MARTKKSTRPSVAKQVRSIIAAGKEKKRWSASFSVTNNVAGQIIDVTTGLVSGDGISNRDGDVVFPTKLHFNYTLTSGVGSTNSSHRILVVQDTMNTGSTPTIASVLDGGLYISTYNLLTSQQGRFKILHDKLHGVIGASSDAVVRVQKVFKLKSPIYYNGTTAVAASNGRNSIFIMALTDSVTVSTAVFTGQYQLEYTDA